MGELLNLSWDYKKQMADGISNQQIDKIYNAAIEAGATGGKISGAGGGGFMFFYCPGITRYNVIKALEHLAVTPEDTSLQTGTGDLDILVLCKMYFDKLLLRIYYNLFNSLLRIADLRLRNKSRKASKIRIQIIRNPHSEPSQRRARRSQIRNDHN